MKFDKDLKEEDILSLALEKIPEGYHPTSFICWYDFKNYPNEGMSLIQRWDHMLKDSIWISLPSYEEMRKNL